jgi:nitrite reductase/ring-hydroxylating ferredoxin subunit
MKKLSMIVIALATFLQAAQLSDTCNQETWVTNGPVYAIAPAGDKVYIGGGFTQVGPYTGCGVPFNTSTGLPVSAFPKINGRVNAVCADGNGGWFVGGHFTSADGVPRNYIAHILSNGSVDPVWNPNANSEVNALAVSGTTVYTGGWFTSIGGQSRNHIAALDVTTGNATTWNPNANNNIYSLAVSGTTVYTGGDFTNIGGQSRNSIAALDVTTGNAMAWNPDVRNALATPYVNALAFSGTIVYAGGNFDNIGGQSRNRIAALDATTGNALAWNPNANGTILSLAVSGAKVYAGGDFDTIGGQVRYNIAALDLATGNALAFNPHANSTVYSLVVIGATVYAGGRFTTINGQSRDNIAAMDSSIGNLLALNPKITGPGMNIMGTPGIYSLAVSGTTLYVGGYFNSIGCQARNNIAAFDATTGHALAWNPNANQRIVALAVSGTTVYAGGYFDTIGGQSRHYIAALDMTTGNVLPCDPNVSNMPYTTSYVSSIAVSGTTVYAGGAFDSIGGQSRFNVSALDATTGNALAWNTKTNGTVYSLVKSGTTVYIGGEFNTIGNIIGWQGRNHIAALDATTGSALAWNPNTNGTILSLAVSGTTVYAGGGFDNMGGQSRANIAALDGTTGNALAWNPNVNGGISSLAVNGSTVYAAGNFGTIGGQSRNSIAALDATTGNALSWDPNANEPVHSVAVSGGRVYVGGEFTSIGQGIGHSFFAQFDSLPPTPVIRPISPSSGFNNTGLQIIKLGGSNFRSGAFVKFAYALPKAEHVYLRLYSINGQMQSELVNKREDAGYHTLNMQRGMLATGVYLVVFKAGDYHQEKMISLMK